MDRAPAPAPVRLDPAPDPVEACARMLDLPYPILLDGCGTGWSYLSADPALVFRSRGAVTEQLASPGGAWTAVEGDVLLAARAALAPHRSTFPASVPIPFQGGLAGYVGYEYGGRLERLPPPRAGLPIPDVLLGLYDWTIAWDHATGEAWLVSTGLPEAGAARTHRAAHRREMVLHRLRAAPPAPPALPPAELAEVPTFAVPGRAAIGLRSTFPRDAYLAAVARVREYILAGDIFQANLAQRFDAPLGATPWAYYRRLRARNPAPFAAYLGLDAAAILSVSPELFLRVAPDGTAETRPIKGTRPRGADPAADAALAAELVASAKDRAENVMIVDLLRNDLSRVAVPGTVAVPALLALESHPTVHHLVSTVTARLAPEYDAVDLLRAAFPGGSITGAPKVRAMEIIAELEPTARGVYCGAIGYLSTTGALATSVAIRTAVAAGGRLHFAAGGGIVADSEPAAEYAETLAKARAFIETLEAPLEAPAASGG